MTNIKLNSSRAYEEWIMGKEGLLIYNISIRNRSRFFFENDRAVINHPTYTIIEEFYDYCN